jgi:hypothetical protein
MVESKALCIFHLNSVPRLRSIYIGAISKVVLLYDSLYHILDDGQTSNNTTEMYRGAKSLVEIMPVICRDTVC